VAYYRVSSNTAADLTRVLVMGDTVLAQGMAGVVAKVMADTASSNNPSTSSRTNPRSQAWELGPGSPLVPVPVYWEVCSSLTVSSISTTKAMTTASTTAMMMEEASMTSEMAVTLVILVLQTTLACNLLGICM